MGKRDGVVKVPTWKKYETDEKGLFHCPVYAVEQVGSCDLYGSETGGGFSGGKTVTLYRCGKGHKWAVHTQQGLHGPELTSIPIHDAPAFGAEI